MPPSLPASYALLKRIMKNQGLDLHITLFRRKNFQMKARSETKHNSADFGFFPFFSAP